MTHPANWYVDVVVLRSGGRDPKGNPLPEVEIPRPGCLVGWRSTAEPLDRADLTSDAAVLYDRQRRDFQSTDRIRVPAGPWPTGTWLVDGQPKAWPKGTEVPLRR